MTSLRIAASIVVLAATGLVLGCAEKLTESEQMQSAAQAYEQGKYRDALIALKNLLQANPNNKDARLLLGRTSLQLGDPDAAEKELTRAMELGATADEYYLPSLEAKLQLGKSQDIVGFFNPNDLQSESNRNVARILYAEALGKVGRVGEAESAYRDVIDKGAETEAVRRAHLGLGLLQQSAGQIADAKSSFQTAYDYDDRAPDTLVAFGKLLLSQRDYAGAQQFFQQGRDLKVVSSNQKFLLVTGEVESALGLQDKDAAKQSANRLYSLAAPHPVTNFLLARVANLDGDKDAAYEYVQASLAKAPKYRPAQLLQGVLSYERKEYAQAEVLLRGILDSQPGNLQVRKLLAEIYLKTDKPEKAVTLLNSAIASGAADQQMLGMLSRASMSVDNGDTSIAYIERALRRDPKNVQLKQALAASYVSAGRARDALALVEDGELEFDDRRKELVRFLAAVQDNDSTTARSLAGRITSTWPDSTQSNNLIGGWYYQQGELEKASELFERVYAGQSNDLNALTSLGRIDIEKKRYAQAQSRYQEFLTRNPTSEPGLLSLAYLHEVQGQSSKALDYLVQAHNAHPASEAPLSLLVRANLADKNYKKAAEYADKAVAANPQSGNALLMRGIVEMNRGDFEKANNAFGMAAQLQPDSGEILRNKARSEFALEMYEPARKSYAKLMGLEPANLDGAREFIQLELQLGDSARAQAILNELKAARPGDAAVLELEGDINGRLGEVGDALTVYKAAFQRSPSRELAIKQFRLVQQSGGDGITHLTDWLAVSPEDDSIRELLAQSLQIKGSTSSAITEYEDLLKSKPNSPTVLNNLAWLYFEQGDTASKNQAVVLAKRAYELASSNAQIVDTYGWLLLRSGNLALGLETLAEAATLAKQQNSPTLNTIIYHHAVALNESGDSAGARNLLVQVLSGDTQFSGRSDAQKLLDTL